MQGFLSAALLAAWQWGDKSDVEIPMALFYALLGILVVFAVLFILILLFTLLEQVFKFDLIDRGTAAVKRFFKRLFGRKKKAEAIPAAEPAAVLAETNDEEEIAAVMAAVTVLMTSETGIPAPFVIRSIKRTHTH